MKHSYSNFVTKITKLAKDGTRIRVDASSHIKVWQV